MAVVVDRLSKPFEHISVHFWTEFRTWYNGKTLCYLSPDSFFAGETRAGLQVNKAATRLVGSELITWILAFIITRCGSCWPRLNDPGFEWAKMLRLERSSLEGWPNADDGSCAETLALACFTKKHGVEKKPPLLQMVADVRIMFVRFGLARPRPLFGGLLYNTVWNWPTGNRPKNLTSGTNQGLRLAALNTKCGG